MSGRATLAIKRGGNPSLRFPRAVWYTFRRSVVVNEVGGGAAHFLFPSTVQPSELEKLVLPELELLGFECVKLEIVGSARNPVVRLFIDKPGGVTVGECARVSRTLGLVFEREDPFPGQYLLEVSSPGSNRPLVNEENYRRFAGSDARVTVEGPEGKVTHTGRIVGCVDGVVTLAVEAGEITIPVRDIVRAHLVRDYKIDKKQEKDRRPARDARRRGEESE